jgi:hypothetical protein
MSVYSTRYHAMVPSPGPARTESRTEPRTEPRTESVTSTAIKPADAGAEDEEGFFGHLLDVINPLQHLPVIGTIYRAITGDKMGSFEKIAGDTLYGGMWGAITSIADVAFEGITGKSFEDTALSLFKSDSKAKGNKVAATQVSFTGTLPSADVPMLPTGNVPDGLDVAAFTSALSAKGVDSETANRALYAYRRSMGLVGVGQQPVLATVH